jgi:hypothetical protein
VPAAMTSGSTRKSRRREKRRDTTLLRCWLFTVRSSDYEPSTAEPVRRYSCLLI